MTIAKIKDQLGLLSRTEAEAPAAPDPRDATIERLEHEVAEEREHAATLRKTIEELRFKSEVLEKSYSKQLEDARQRSETSERELEDQKARIAELDGSDQDAMRLLSEARAELKRVTSQRDRLRKSFTSTGSVQIEATERISTESQPPSDDMSINALMEDSLWAHEQKRLNKQRGIEGTQASADEVSLPEEMVSPELVFASQPNDNEDT
jgi:DNA repair exonuclease SbcCD ATPase subunit